MKISDMVYIDVLNLSLSPEDYVEASVKDNNGLFQTVKITINDIANCVRGHNVLTQKIDNILSNIPDDGEIGDVYAKINSSNFYDFFIVAKMED